MLKPGGVGGVGGCKKISDLLMSLLRRISLSYNELKKMSGVDDVGENVVGDNDDDGENVVGDDDDDDGETKEEKEQRQQNEFSSSSFCDGRPRVGE